MTQVIGEVLKAFRQNVPDCIAAGIVDMSTGMLLGYDAVERYPTELSDLFSAATRDLFQGRNVLMLEQRWKEFRGVTESRHYFQEILVNSNNLVHLFLRKEGQSDLVASVVCRQGVNLGMMFASARMVMKQLDALN